MRRHLGQRAYTVAYGRAGEDGMTVTVDTRTGAKSAAPSEGPDSPAVRIVFYPWNWTYESVVAAIINTEIPPDEMTAIQNNYTERVIAPLLDPSAIAVADPPASAIAYADPPVIVVSDPPASAIVVSDSESRESASGDASTPEPTDATTAVSDSSEADTADPSEAIEAERERLRLEASAEMSRMQTVRARAKLLARHAISATAV